MVKKTRKKPEDNEYLALVWNRQATTGGEIMKKEDIRGVVSLELSVVKELLLHEHLLRLRVAECSRTGRLFLPFRRLRTLAHRGRGSVERMKLHTNHGVVNRCAPVCVDNTRRFCSHSARRTGS